MSVLTELWALLFLQYLHRAGRCGFARLGCDFCQNYEALRNRAHPPERDVEPESTAATLTRIDYDLRVDASVASGTANLTVDVVKDGWVLLRFHKGLLVRDAEVGSEPVSLVSMPGKSAQLLAVLSKRGRSTLALNVAFSCFVLGRRGALSLPCWLVRSHARRHRVFATGGGRENRRRVHCRKIHIPVDRLCPRRPSPTFMAQEDRGAPGRASDAPARVPGAALRVGRGFHCFQCGGRNRSRRERRVAGENPGFGRIDRKSSPRRQRRRLGRQER